jgi:hypothetical protein
MVSTVVQVRQGFKDGTIIPSVAQGEEGGATVANINGNRLHGALNPVSEGELFPYERAEAKVPAFLKRRALV